MRIGVFNDHWATLGGGEKLTAAYAQALVPLGDVELLGPGHVDLNVVCERLGVDLDGVGWNEVRADPAAVSNASAAYDVFVNCSFHSKVRNQAPKGVHVVHFPEQPPGCVFAAVRALADRRRAVSDAPEHTFGPGFYPLESEGSRKYRWTNGDASLVVNNGSGRHVVLSVTVSGEHRPAGMPDELTCIVNCVEQRRRLASDGPTRLAFSVEPATTTVIRLVSDTFAVEGDPRSFGVQVLEVSEAGWGQEMKAMLAQQNHVDHTYDFLATYDLFLANSEFTRAAIEHCWGRPSEVVYPGVRARDPGPKRKVILGVGRFFGEASGHSKKQRAMVEAFRTLHHRQFANGWRLVLAGAATAHDTYLEEVRAVAAGLPVEVMANVSGATLNELLAEASIYWHAAGLGEDAVAHPSRFEHFGISVVEAMSAGAVPVVLGVGGPAEIVEDGVSGLHYFDAEELVAQTALLIDDLATRARLRDGAVVRAKAFAEAPFQQRVQAVIRRLTVD